MRNIRSAIPRPELREFIRIFAQREITSDEPESSQPNIAVLEQVLSFELRDRMVLDYPGQPRQDCSAVNLWGSLTHPFGCHQFRGHIIGFALFLNPHASWQLFHVPPVVLANLRFDGQEVLGNSLQELWHLVADSKSFAERVRRAEDFLLPFAFRALEPTPIMRSARYLSAHHGAIRIERLAQHTALGVRQYERRFLNEIGCSPKLYARITRFQSALDAKRLFPLRTWLSIAHQLGFADQMHMVRDFHSLAGRSPAQAVQQSDDMHPWSLDEFTDLPRRSRVSTSTS
jgi:AraC-like DNA-binding protein